MATTIETVEEERPAPAVVDHLGYAYCRDCRAKGRGHEPVRTVDPESCFHFGERCDGCGRDFRAVLEIRRRRVVVEHFSCRVF